MKTIAAVVGAFAAVVAAIALAAAAIAAFAATAAAHQAEFASLAFVVAAVAFVVAVVAALVRIAANAFTENAAAAVTPKNKPGPNQAEPFNAALETTVNLNWWDRDFRTRDEDSVATCIAIRDFRAERRNIQLGLEVRYSLLELATRRLTESLRRTGLTASARELPFSMTGRVHRSKGKIGLTSEDVEGEFSLTGQVREAGNIAGAREQIGDFEFLPSLSIWQLATIDVFVEKAQYFLTTRIKQNECFARCATVATLVFMALALCFGLAAFDHSGFFQSFVHVPEPPGTNDANNQNSGSKSTDWETLLFVFLGNTTLLGLLLGIAYFFASLTRAFLHEATILKNRRHSVRLGRLVLHMKVSSARSPEHLAEIIAALNINDLEQAFGWNLETSTAFKDINPEAMTTSLTGQLLATLQKVSDTFGSDKKPG